MNQDKTMPLGLVNDDEFLSELNKSSEPESRGEVINLPSRGRKSGDNNVPDALRNIIGGNAIEEGSKETKELTRAFGISDSSLSAYKNGATSTTTYHTPKPELSKSVNDVRDKITSRAKNRLLKAISHITDEKMRDTKAIDLAGIARNLSAVVKNIEPEAPRVNPGNGPTFVVFAPPKKREESYEVINLKE